MEDRVVLLTGGGGGIARGVARAFADEVSSTTRSSILLKCCIITLVEHTQADFDKAIYSGLYATFFYMKHAFPYLKESHGSVINFASGAGISGKPGQSSYAAAKEGIRGLSRVAANEWGPYDINVNVVLPLVMTDKLAQWGQENPEMFKKNLDEIPLGRYGDAQKDIGKVCVFLASYDAKYITGDTLFIQGGVGMKP